MKTGFKKLDEVIDMQDGNLIILGGTASVGKTNLALNIINNIAINEKKSVLFFSLECSKETIKNKIISIAGMIQAPNILDISKKIEAKDVASSKLQETIKKIEEAPIYIDDTPGISSKEICKKSMKIEKDISCIIIDYLQLMSYDKNKNLSRDLETKEILKDLKELAQTLNIPILLISYISHAKIYRRENHVPTLEDLTLNNMGYEKYVDIILLLHREECFDEFTQKKNVADIIIAKSKNDMKTNVELAWLPKYLKFCDI